MDLGLLGPFLPLSEQLNRYSSQFSDKMTRYRTARFAASCKFDGSFIARTFKKDRSWCVAERLVLDAIANRKPQTLNP